ncbi:helix-turn-helix domain-containing protein [Rhodovulum visakhapatnamense]|uniref:Transcriptional regulator with XRE-family HTH domain n=1 Tax=Rhodovulum visakhapatnamense TaxID=364297 RepID=A0A4R8FEA9_9RHOB|nr:helix-turn-helix transcriptional regulator [Rhodovulum visakhapatnamense]TDX21107.1 transcriptional regulator with XRE-family HTH domain [Rhodovulum visakhapatnamense]
MTDANEESFNPEDYDGPEMNDQALSDLLVPELFRKALDRAGINQSELARRSGLTREAISRYATGRTPIPDAKLIVIAQALETQPSRIVPKRRNLDGIPPRGPDDPEFIIRPGSTPGLVRLEIAAEIELETATKIVAMMTKKKPHDEDD